VVNFHAALSHDLFEIPIGNGIPEIDENLLENGVAGKVAAL